MAIKKTIFLIISCFTIASVNAQVDTDFAIFSISKDPSYYISSTSVSPGNFDTHDYSELPYTLTTEVTVGNYLFFLSKIYQDSSLQYFASMIPSDKSLVAKYLNKEYQPDKKEIKLLHKEKIADYPITGITYAQAQEYVLWATLYYNLEFLKNTGYHEEVIIFRLMTPEEYNNMQELRMTWFCVEQNIRNSNIKYYTQCKNDEGCALCNVADKDDCENNRKFEERYGKKLSPVALFWPDCSGLYDIQGNAAEMTTEESIAKGGSYFHASSETLAGTVQMYSQPEEWLGFRIIALQEAIDGSYIYYDSESQELFIDPEVIFYERK